MPESPQLHLNMEPCAFCGAPSTMLCDYVIGFKIGGICDPMPNRPEIPLYARPSSMMPYRYIDTNAEQYICDTPFCESCGTNKGQWFWHGEDGGDIETIDHCPIHADKENMGNGIRVLTEDEAATDRKQIRIAIQKTRMTRSSV